MIRLVTPRNKVDASAWSNNTTITHPNGNNNSNSNNSMMTKRISFFVGPAPIHVPCHHNNSNTFNRGSTHLIISSTQKSPTKSA